LGERLLLILPFYASLLMCFLSIKGSPKKKSRVDHAKAVTEITPVSGMKAMAVHSPSYVSTTASLYVKLITSKFIYVAKRSPPTSHLTWIWKAVLPCGFSLFLYLSLIWP
jgi:hypothetical protein